MSWLLFKNHYLALAELGFALDTSRVGFSPEFLKMMEPKTQCAFQDMQSLEAGAVANPDENRLVGHYWLRAPELAPTPDLRKEIQETLAAIKRFAAEVHGGTQRGSSGTFKNLVCIGIGGSALGPQFVAAALGEPSKLQVDFIDNTDPDGFDIVWHRLEKELGQTLVVVISKSGSTPEPRNAMIEAEAVYKRAGLSFGAHAVAVTGVDSQLDRYAKTNGWLARFPMWDWVGGRTSELAAVGLLPAALQGIDIDELLRGAHEMDKVTREASNNPAMQLALAWYCLSNGKGSKDMVIIPYKDRLALFARYLQQLIMESLGKEKDLDGAIVEQGLSVFGNKGSTDQHAYVQQLRDGVHNFFATFIEVQKDRVGASLEVEPGITAGDYLQGFYLGTREALYDKGRRSITLTIREISPFTIGMLIALYERAVGFYASFIHINAYHQPGVEAGKKAASTILSLQAKAVEHLRVVAPKALSAEKLAQAINAPERTETLFKLLEHLAANTDRHVMLHPAATATNNCYSWKG